MKKLLIISFLLCSLLLQATDYYLSPTGDDVTGDGSIGSPWFTLNKAWTVVTAGDIIYLRDGTYSYVSRQYLTGVNGTAADTIKVFAYPGETPVLTEDAIYSVPAWPNFFVHVAGDYTYWKGITIYEVTSSGAFIIYNSDHNKIENFNVHRNMNGLYVYGGDANLIHNSDFYNNYDPLTSYGNADGLAIASNTNVSSSNTVRGCRFYENSDDGIDLYNNDGYVIIDSCWSWANGYREDKITAGGDGNGFKLGRTSIDEGTVFKRTLTNNMAFYNRRYGFDQNQANCKMYFYNNIAYHNLNYGIILYYYDLAHVLRNNTSFSNVAHDFYGTHTNAIIDHNSYDAAWEPTGPLASAADFVSVDTSGISGARQANGTLPLLNFLRLASTSDLIDAGIDVGISYVGTAPDLGVWEYVAPNPPDPPLIMVGDTTKITTRHIVIDGNVTDDGGGTVSDRGVCWALTEDPDVNDNSISYESGTGTFTATIPILGSTTYHIRFYCTNEDSTTYSEDIELTTPDYTQSVSGGKAQMINGKRAIIK